jgi:zinc knuckle protein
MRYSVPSSESDYCSAPSSPRISSDWPREGTREEDRDMSHQQQEPMGDVPMSTSGDINELLEQLRTSTIANETLIRQNREVNARLLALEAAVHNAALAAANPSVNTGSDSTPAPPTPPATTTIQRKATKWPVWDGKTDSFKTHACLLRVKIEEDRSILGTDRAICMGMFNSIPADKRPRISHWFETGGPTGGYDWEEFLGVLKDKFEDRQAKQTAGDQLSRMRMGITQHFADYLQDFEFKLSQCDGLGWPDRTKIIYLNNSINSKLREKLVSKSLPDDDYTKWTRKVQDVASRLESLPSYRPKGSTNTKTWYLGQGSSGRHAQDAPEQAETQTPKVDYDGDTLMTGVSGLSISNLATLINAIQGNRNRGGGRGRRQQSRKENDRPKAPWRSQDAIRRLAAQNKCFRCEKVGHRSHECPTYRPAAKPQVSGVNNAETITEGKEEEESFSESGNE